MGGKDAGEYSNLIDTRGNARAANLLRELESIRDPSTTSHGAALIGIDTFHARGADGLRAIAQSVRRR